ncbi:MAG TPA: filamentous hemagglutinin N-terminal domain-containing protein [Alphaproteobacteria bacterium]|nr:filamentous hemagglutinin N-terminal domain-containing protein [Alphaproteobacteria bacterium]HQS93479.1 filamentous hemagglutinin N-terminal domain-containing protein [Alphaproteobacteria bacterium]
MSANVHSMSDVLPPPAPVGGDGPSVSLPDAVPIPENLVMDTGLSPQDLANIDPATLSNIQSMAHPSNYKIEAGNMIIWAPNSNTLRVDQFPGLPGSQASQDAPITGIVNFKNFSTLADEAIEVRYLDYNGMLRNNSQDSTLIRVVGGEPSTFSGNFFSNGNVALSNPAGIIFEKGSNTTVRGLIATTAHITNEDFLRGSHTGRYNFTKGAQDGAIVNHGQINLVSGGFAALLGNTVRDDGVMLGQLSRVIVAGAESYVLSFDGDSLIGFEITSTRENKEGQPHKKPSVEHSGSIVNKGGLVLVTTKDAQKFVFEDSVNIKNIPQAASVEEKDGVITLKGTISVDGPQGGSIWAESSKDMILDHATLTANGTEQKGGNVTVLGPELRSFGSTLRADGKLGGGRVLFGGDFQGKNPNINNSKNTFLDNETVLSVNALENGNGGQFVIWANNLTQNGSTTESKGGANGGNGGPKNEISGKNDLFHRGKVNTLAPMGEHGTTLFDPANITVLIGGLAGLPQTYTTPLGGSSQIDPSTLVATLSNILLQATNDITITNGFTLGNGYTLTMSAGRNIILNDAIATQNANMTLTANAANAVFHGGRADTTAGSIQNPVGHALSSGTGLITLKVDSTVPGVNAAGYIDVGPISSSKGVTVNTAGQNVNLHGDITSTAGDINLTAGIGANIVAAAPLTLHTTDASNIVLNNALVGGGNDVTLATGTGGVVTLAGGASGVHNFPVTGSGGINIGGNISSSAAQTYDGPVTLTGTSNITFTTTTGGNINFNNNITGNSYNLTLSPSGTYFLNLTGAVTNINAFQTTGAGQNKLSGSISAVSQTFNNLILIGNLLLTTTGDLNFAAGVLGAHALTLDIGGNLLYPVGALAPYLFNGQSSLTIKNGSGFGTHDHPITINLGDASPFAPHPTVLFLGSTQGGFFQGNLNDNLGVNTQYAALLGTASGSFYVNNLLLPYPSPSQTSPVDKQQAGTINDTADKAVDAPDITSETTSDEEKQKKKLKLISAATPDLADAIISAAEASGSESSSAVSVSGDE